MCHSFGSCAVVAKHWVLGHIFHSHPHQGVSVAVQFCSWVKKPGCSSDLLPHGDQLIFPSSLQKSATLMFSRKEDHMMWLTWSQCCMLLFDWLIDFWSLCCVMEWATLTGCPLVDVDYPQSPRAKHVLQLNMFSLVNDLQWDRYQLICSYGTATLPQLPLMQCLSLLGFKHLGSVTRPSWQCDQVIVARLLWPGHHGSVARSLWQGDQIILAVWPGCCGGDQVVVTVWPGCCGSVAWALKWSILICCPLSINAYMDTNNSVTVCQICLNSQPPGLTQKQKHHLVSETKLMVWCQCVQRVSVLTSE